MADKSSTNKFPQALAHQQRMLQSRFPPAQSRDDDARSDASWTTVRTSEVGDAESLAAGADQHQGRGMDPIAEEVGNDLHRLLRMLGGILPLQVRLR